jgi:hypothetical protein
MAVAVSSSDEKNLSLNRMGGGSNLDTIRSSFEVAQTRRGDLPYYTRIVRDGRAP